MVFAKLDLLIVGSRKHADASRAATEKPSLHTRDPGPGHSFVQLGMSGPEARGCQPVPASKIINKCYDGARSLLEGEAIDASRAAQEKNKSLQGSRHHVAPPRAANSRGRIKGQREVIRERGRNLSAPPRWDRRIGFSPHHVESCPGMVSCSQNIDARCSNHSQFKPNIRQSTLMSLGQL